MSIARAFPTLAVSNHCLSRQVACAALFSLISVAISTATFAASINYGDFGPVPPGVSFLQVKESSGTDPVPLYGPPTPFSVGLDFDPATFVSESTNGGVDFTDGQLNFTIMSQAGITDVSLSENGDYSLIGIGTAGTEALAGVIMRATVTQVNGVNVAPFNLLPVSASVGFDLVNNAGLVQPWGLGLGLNVAGQLQPGQNATKIEIVIDNQLATVSEAGSGAFIAKKDFRIGVGIVPEPATFALTGIAVCGLLAGGRRRRFV